MSNPPDSPVLDALLPCPWCSREVIVTRLSTGYSVSCHVGADHDASVNWDSRDGAIAAWNRRTPQSPSGRLLALEAVAEAARDYITGSSLRLSVVADAIDALDATASVQPAPQEGARCVACGEPVLLGQSYVGPALEYPDVRGERRHIVCGGGEREAK